MAARADRTRHGPIGGLASAAAPPDGPQRGLDARQGGVEIVRQRRECRQRPSGRSSWASSLQDVRGLDQPARARPASPGSARRRSGASPARTATARRSTRRWSERRRPRRLSPGISVVVGPVALGRSPSGSPARTPGRAATRSASAVAGGAVRPGRPQRRRRAGRASRRSACRPGAPTPSRACPG